jgi:hypothetical protein
MHLEVKRMQPRTSACGGRIHPSALARATFAFILGLVLALVPPEAARADHGSPTNETVDNGLLASDPAFFSVSWDEGGSSSIVFDGLNQAFRYEPYLAYDPGSGLIVQSLSSFGTSTFSTSSGPTYTPRVSGDSHGSVTETRANGTLSVQGTGSIADGSNEFIGNYSITNISGGQLDDVSVYLYLDGDIGLSLADDLGSTAGSTSSPYNGLKLILSDSGGSAMALSFFDVFAEVGPSSFEIGDAATLLSKVEAGLTLGNTVTTGPGDLAAAFQFNLGTLLNGGSGQVIGRVIANPIPEPGTLSLLAIGLACLRRGLARHRSQ